jgi:hypothetical protein
MANTVFPTFQTPYILDFSSASRWVTLGFAKRFCYVIFNSHMFNATEVQL